MQPDEGWRMDRQKRCVNNTKLGETKWPKSTTTVVISFFLDNLIARESRFDNNLKRKKQSQLDSYALLQKGTVMYSNLGKQFSFDSLEKEKWGTVLIIVTRDWEFDMMSQRLGPSNTIKRNPKQIMLSQHQLLAIIANNW